MAFAIVSTKVDALEELCNKHTVEQKRNVTFASVYNAARLHIKANTTCSVWDWSFYIKRINFCCCCLTETTRCLWKLKK